MRACEGPARRHAVAFGDLLIDREAQVWKQLAVERNRLACSVDPAVFEGVDVVDELRW
jgi:hypothetical protein